MIGFTSRFTALSVVCLPLWFAGCSLLHEYRPMRVLVRDAESKEPIPNAEIEGWYDTMLDFLGPRPPHGVADTSGVVTLWIGPKRSFSLRLDEPGYPMTTIGFNVEYFESLPKSSRTNDNPGRIDRVIDLQMDSKPTFVAIVPNGYRGLIRMRFVHAEESQAKATRIFSAKADASGHATFRLPRSIYGTDAGRDYGARYSNGKKVPWDARSPNSEKIAVRHLGNTEDTEMLLIGTGPEAEAIYERILVRVNGSSTLDRAAYEKMFSER